MAESQQADKIRMVVELDELEIESHARAAQEKINQRLEEADTGKKSVVAQPPQPGPPAAKKEKERDPAPAIKSLGHTLSERIGGIFEKFFGKGQRPTAKPRVIGGDAAAEQLKGAAESPHSHSERTRTQTNLFARVLGDRLGGVFRNLFGKPSATMNQILSGMGRIGGGLARGIGGAGRFFGFGAGGVPVGPGSGGVGGAGGGLGPAAMGALKFAGAIGIAVLALKAFSGFMNNKVDTLGKLNPKTALQQSLYERDQMLYERKKAKAWEGAMTEWIQAKRDMFKATEGVRLWIAKASGAVTKTLIRGVRGIADPGLWVQPINQDARSSLGNVNPNSAFANGMRIDTGRFGTPVIAPGGGAGQMPSQQNPSAPSRPAYSSLPSSSPSQPSPAPGPQYQMPSPQIPKLENNIRYDAQFNVNHEAAVMQTIENFRSWILRGLNTARDETRLIADQIDGRNVANLF